MEGKQDDTRWFLIKHEECGSIITIRAKKFVELHKLHNKSPDNLTYLACPSCVGTILKAETTTRLQRFLSSYHELIKVFASKDFTIKDIEQLIRGYHELIQALKSEGFTIREIKEEISPEKLKL